MAYPKDRKIVGGAIRLGTEVDIRVMAVAEGLETSLAVMEGTGLPVWCAVNALLLENLVPPSTVERVIVFADKDRPTEQHPRGHGQEAVRQLVQRLWKTGIQASAIVPVGDIQTGQKSEDARILLNGMFNEMDYPTVEDMRTKFAIELETLPLPSAEDFRVTLANGEVARIQREIETRLQREFLKSNQDLWNRLRLAVDNMALRLGNPEGRFHDSLIGNLQAIVELVPKLNVTGDENLEKISATCADTLTGYDPRALRDDPGLRAKVAAQAKEISSIMDAYMAF